MEDKISKKFLFLLFGIILFCSLTSSFEWDAGGGIGIDIKVVENASQYENNSDIDNNENIEINSDRDEEEDEDQDNEKDKREVKEELKTVDIHEKKINFSESILPIKLEAKNYEKDINYNLLLGLIFLFVILCLVFSLLFIKKK